MFINYNGAMVHREEPWFLIQTFQTIEGSHIVELGDVVKPEFTYL